MKNVSQKNHDATVSNSLVLNAQRVDNQDVSNQSADIPGVDLGLVLDYYSPADNLISEHQQGGVTDKAVVDPWANYLSGMMSLFPSLLSLSYGTWQDEATRNRDLKAITERPFQSYAATLCDQSHQPRLVNKAYYVLFSSLLESAVSPCDQLRVIARKVKAAYQGNVSDSCYKVAIPYWTAGGVSVDRWTSGGVGHWTLLILNISFFGHTKVTSSATSSSSRPGGASDQTPQCSIHVEHYDSTQACSSHVINLNYLEHFCATNSFYRRSRQDNAEYMKSVSQQEKTSVAPPKMRQVSCLHGGDGQLKNIAPDSLLQLVFQAFDVELSDCVNLSNQISVGNEIAVQRQQYDGTTCGAHVTDLMLALAQGRLGEYACGRLEPLTPRQYAERSLELKNQQVDAVNRLLESTPALQNQVVQHLSPVEQANELPQDYDSSSLNQCRLRMIKHKDMLACARRLKTLLNNENTTASIKITSINSVLNEVSKFDDELVRWLRSVIFCAGVNAPVWARGGESLLQQVVDNIPSEDEARLLDFAQFSSNSQTLDCCLQIFRMVSKKEGSEWRMTQGRQAIYSLCDNLASSQPADAKLLKSLLFKQDSIESEWRSEGQSYEWVIDCVSGFFSGWNVLFPLLSSSAGLKPFAVLKQSEIKALKDVSVKDYLCMKQRFLSGQRYDVELVANSMRELFLDSSVTAVLKTRVAVDLMVEYLIAEMKKNTSQKASLGYYSCGGYSGFDRFNKVIFSGNEWQSFVSFFPAEMISLLILFFESAQYSSSTTLMSQLVYTVSIRYEDEQQLIDIFKGIQHILNECENKPNNALKGQIKEYLALIDQVTHCDSKDKGYEFWLSFDSQLKSYKKRCEKLSSDNPGGYKNWVDLMNRIDKVQKIEILASLFQWEKRTHSLSGNQKACASSIGFFRQAINGLSTFNQLAIRSAGTAASSSSAWCLQKQLGSSLYMYLAASNEPEKVASVIYGFCEKRKRRSYSDLFQDRATKRAKNQPDESHKPASQISAQETINLADVFLPLR